MLRHIYKMCALGLSFCFSAASFAGLSCENLSGSWSAKDFDNAKFNITIHDNGSSDSKPFTLSYDDMPGTPDPHHLRLDKNASCRQLGDGSLKLHWRGQVEDSEDDPVTVGLNLRVANPDSLNYSVWAEIEADEGDGSLIIGWKDKMTRDN